MRVSWVRWGVVAGMLCAIACGGTRTPVQPDDPVATLAGTWVGPVNESPGGGDGRLRLTIAQVDAGLWGTFALEFPDASFNRAGTTNGIDASPPFLNGRSPDSADCPEGRVLGGSFITLTWTRTGDTLSGTYDGYACFGLVAGRFTVTLDR